jgi:hypothetical protein
MCVCEFGYATIIIITFVAWTSNMHVTIYPFLKNKTAWARQSECVININILSASLSATVCEKSADLWQQWSKKRTGRCQAQTSPPALAGRRIAQTF